MDGNTFDNVSRALARGLPRRRMIGRFGLGVLGAALLGRSAPARAAETCTIQLVAAVGIGPGTGATFAGALTITIEEEGAIDEGLLITTDGEELEVTGHATGREIRLLVDLGDGTSLALSGVAERDVQLCRGDFAGTFAGPQSGDLGSWVARKGSAPGGGASSGGSSTGSNGGGGGTSGGGGNSGGNSGGGSDNGNSSGDGDGDGGSGGDGNGCPSGQTACPGGCVDLFSNNDHCGACGNFCASGTVCENATCVDAGCGNDPNTGNPLEVCNGICVDVMEDNDNCGACGIGCLDSYFCTDGICQCFFTADGPRATDCGSFCADLLTDVRNCGACGFVCEGYNRQCENGQCVCSPSGCINPALTPCPTPGGDPCVKFCVDVMSDPYNCGACGNFCITGCSNGRCADLDFPDL